MDNQTRSQVQSQKENSELIHDLEPEKGESMFSTKVIIFLFVIALLGIGTGFFLAINQSVKIVDISKITNSSQLSKGSIYGSSDLKTFNDTAEGIMKTGGIEDEGQFHLLRPGGDSQNVYMTSSIIDLSKFIDRKVKVWGQTQKAKKAGWLMDIGRVQIIE